MRNIPRGEDSKPESPASAGLEPLEANFFYDIRRKRSLGVVLCQLAEDLCREAEASLNEVTGDGCAEGGN